MKPRHPEKDKESHFSIGLRGDNPLRLILIRLNIIGANILMVTQTPADIPIDGKIALLELEIYQITELECRPSQSKLDDILTVLSIRIVLI